ncbi:MAG: hypothetical protein ABI480_08280, partial [Chitinophagaceae bacterium]
VATEHGSKQVRSRVRLASGKHEQYFCLYLAAVVKVEEAMVFCREGGKERARIHFFPVPYRLPGKSMNKSYN